MHPLRSTNRTIAHLKEFSLNQIWHNRVFIDATRLQTGVVTESINQPSLRPRHVAKEGRRHTNRPNERRHREYSNSRDFLVPGNEFLVTQCHKEAPHGWSKTGKYLQITEAGEHAGRSNLLINVLALCHEPLSIVQYSIDPTCGQDKREAPSHRKNVAQCVHEKVSLVVAFTVSSSFHDIGNSKTRI